MSTQKLTVVIPKRSKTKKGLPKRVGRTGHKARYARYLERATCIACNKVFRSPVKRRIHVESGHKSDVGLNTSRVRKSTSIFG